MLAGISSASIQGRIALGRRAGRRVWRVGKEPDAPWVLSRHSRHANIAGFDLHANVAVPAADRVRLEQLCRYLLRPPVAQDRLRRMGEDHILLTLKSPWADGTRHLMFTPIELLEKLAALVPRPRQPDPPSRRPDAARAMARPVVAYGALSGTTSTAPNLGGDSGDDTPSPAPRGLGVGEPHAPGFNIDVLACPRCGTLRSNSRISSSTEDLVAAGPQRLQQLCTPGWPASRAWSRIHGPATRSQAISRSRSRPAHTRLDRTVVKEDAP